MRQARRPQRAQTASLPAPVRGLVEDIPTKELPLDSAEWLENFLPTARGIRVRGGTVAFADIGAAVKTLFSYEAGASSKIFAATASGIYEITASLGTGTAEDMIWGLGIWGTDKWATTLTEEVSTLTSGDWSVQQVGTTGGDFLVLVNGSDPAYLYNGTSLVPLVDETVHALDFDGLTTDFVVGETLTGGTSGATAEILGWIKETSTGTLYLGAITGGPFQDNEAITSASGAAAADGTVSTANSTTITNVDTSDLSDVWVYQSRLFFVEKNSLTAWYLPSGAIGGAAASVSLAGVFRKGGTLLLGGTWSLDSGDGMDDKCVFVTDKGEVAIYNGPDPSDASTWALEGRYDLARPLGKRATVQAGGDFLIATDEGIIPVSAAIRKDPAALSLAAVTYNIRNTWREEVAANPENVELVRWTKGNLLFAVFSGSDRMLTCNLQTGAWAFQSGWFGDCATVFNNAVYAGRPDGHVVKLDEGGLDEGVPFTARMAYPFMEMGSPTAYKVTSMARGAFFADTAFRARYSAAVDYRTNFPPPPNVEPLAPTALIWGASSWGVTAWGRAISDPRTGRVDSWNAVSGAGFAVSPQIQITSGSAQRLEVEFVGMDVLWEAGGVAS